MTRVRFLPPLPVKLPNDRKLFCFDSKIRLDIAAEKVYNKNEESAPVDGRSQSSVKKITVKFGRLGGYFLLLCKIVYRNDAAAISRMPS